MFIMILSLLCLFLCVYYNLYLLFIFVMIYFFLEKLSSSARRVHDQACRLGYDEASHDGRSLCQVQHARKEWQRVVQKTTSVQAHNSYVTFTSSVTNPFS